VPNDPRPPDDDSRLVLERGCARCPALVECRERISWGNGPLDAEVMVVGEAPAAGDPEAGAWAGGNHTGLAYTSRHSGRRVRRLLAAAGHPDAFVTNAVKCFPCDGEGSNRQPTAAERRNCRDHLETELARVDPAAVVATGAHATRSVLALDGRSLDGFLDAVLDPVDLDAVDATLLPILHPSYQEVWLSRLGYTDAEYEAAIRDRLP
jgi:uracil-DNA glycosylase family 4